MALIKCRECGKEMSDSAQHCPHCGCQTKKDGTRIDNHILVKISVAAGVALIGLLLFFLNIGKITDNPFIDDIETLYNVLFRFNDMISKVIQKAFWLSMLGTALMIGGAVVVFRCYKEIKNEERKRPNWRCSCGATNSPIVAKCSVCGKSKNDRVSEAPSRPIPTGSIPTWQRLEMEREAARKKAEEESKKS